MSVKHPIWKDLFTSSVRDDVHVALKEIAKMSVEKASIGKEEGIYRIIRQMFCCLCDSTREAKLTRELNSRVADVTT